MRETLSHIWTGGGWILFNGAVLGIAAWNHYPQSNGDRPMTAEVKRGRE